MRTAFSSLLIVLSASVLVLGAPAPVGEFMTADQAKLKPCPGGEKLSKGHCVVITLSASDKNGNVAVTRHLSGNPANPQDLHVSRPYTANTKDLKPSGTEPLSNQGLKVVTKKMGTSTNARR